MKVLIVDDEKNIREPLGEYLTGEGHEVTIATHGQEGIERFKAGDFDLVFMDIKMPGIDGIETFRHMKQMKPRAKVVVMSGMTDGITFDRAASIAPGSIEAFLPKPFKPNDIKNCLEKMKAGEKMATFNLTTGQTEALTKLGNACAENALKAFQQILKREIKIGLKQITIGELKSLYREASVPTVALMVDVSGDIVGKIAVLVSADHGFKLVDLLKRRPAGVTRSFDDNAQIVLKAAGNMFSAACLNALAERLGLPTQSSMPSVALNDRGAIMQLLLKEIGSSRAQPEYIVVIETELDIVDPAITCEILLIPTMESLKQILVKLGALEK
jgi:CheY-like chemotaxis protein